MTASEGMQRLARLLRIVRLIDTRTPGHALGRRELAEECQCHVRTIQRDLDLLCEAGLPLHYDPHRRAYILPEQEWTFPGIHLTVEEVLSLGLARCLLDRPGIPHQQIMLQALDKATSTFPLELKRLLSEAGQVVRTEAGPRDYSRAPIAPLIEAGRDCQTVEIEYQSGSGGEPVWRTVDPYAVEAREGQYWELHGWCHRHMSIRTFALDRVYGIRTTQTRFVIREEEWAAFAGASGVIGGLRGSAAVEVEVIFSSEVASYALARRWPEGLMVVRRPDASVWLTGTALGVAGLLPELLRWRRHAQVRGGVELLAAMQEEVQALHELYFRNKS